VTSRARRYVEILSSGSGPAVARAFDALLALTFLVAWASLAVQASPLLGSRGLLPAGRFVEAARARELGFFDAPTWMLWTGASDRVLGAGLAIGVALAILALVGVAPRVCFAASTLLYLGYVVVGRTFLAFQWDNLLLECGALALLLPRHRRAPWAHLLFRVLLFKLYFESGLAKWQSPLHDWQDGSAMTFYYETAPLPTRFAHLAHAMPALWHAAEAWLTLALELVLPFAIFGPRRARLVAAALFTAFQLANIVTANYGFFAYLAIALHVFLLDDADVVRARRAALGRAPRLRRARVAAALLARRIRRGAALAFAQLRVDRATARLVRRLAIGAVVIAYVAASAAEALAQFASFPDLAWIAEPLAPFRVVNNYHLFASITRERIEPAIQTSDGQTWTTHALWHKAGDPARAPDFVAPHQPRLDFQLWFYGLSFRRGMPEYVERLLQRLCTDPAAVQPFFRDRLPAAPTAVRIAFDRYTFTSREELSATGNWWRVEPLGASNPLTCPR
jgi:lipase maturation factor 1